MFVSELSYKPLAIDWDRSPPPAERIFLLPCSGATGHKQQTHAARREIVRCSGQEKGDIAVEVDKTQFVEPPDDTGGVDDRVTQVSGKVTQLENEPAVGLVADRFVKPVFLVGH